MPITTLRNDKIELDGLLELRLDLKLNAVIGNGRISYSCRQQSDDKDWNFELQPPWTRLRWDARDQFWFYINTLPEAVRKGNAYYDKMLSEYTGKKLNFPDMLKMMDEIRVVCDDYQRKTRREIQEISQRVLSA